MDTLTVKAKCKHHRYESHCDNWSWHDEEQGHSCGDGCEWCDGGREIKLVPAHNGDPGVWVEVTDDINQNT